MSVVHHIWIGPQPIPELARECLLSWRKYQPGWDQIIWRDEDVFNLPLTGELCRGFQSFPVFASDIARAEIVFNHGGFYADCDIELLRPVDFFLESGGPVVGKRVNYRKPSKNGAVGFFFGFPAGHPFLKKTIEHFRGLVPTLEEGFPYKPERNGIDGFWQDNLPPSIPFQWLANFRGSLLGKKTFMFAREELFAIHHLMGSWK